ncbi:MAG TPA: excalibur calcium-binding domain-containing protein [Steroidobacteraceae bacterium]|nr:excalibur calcium-binding domain-containing protein [Steroidobacteraceae bacterium]
MRNVVTLIVIAGLAWYGYTRYQAAAHRDGGPPRSERAASFNCDGRTHCSQMTSCAEATYFAKHCPNTKMDGDNDGVPCESQWCR